MSNEMLDGNIIKPDFLIIGAPRAGTSWLWEMLKQHPDIDLPKVKEPFFFGASEIYENGFEWYYELFSDLDSSKVTGDGSTSNFYDKVPYFYNKGHELKHDHSLPLIPKLITDALPDVKIFICLRDPVARAISHYGLWLGQGKISPFSDLKKPAVERKKFRIIEYGHYAKYLKLWKEYVPPERMRIIIFEEDIVQQPKRTIKDAFGFLGLGTNIIPESLDNKVNRSKGWSRMLLGYYLGEQISHLTQRKPFRLVFDWLDSLNLLSPLDVSKADIDFLRSTYLPEKLELEKLLGRKLDCWKYGSK